MNVDAVEAYGRKLQDRANDFQGQVNGLISELEGLEWQGPDQQRMIGDLQGVGKQALNILEQLSLKGQEIVLQAGQQRTASEA
jgi:hypothetical protein